MYEPVVDRTHVIGFLGHGLVLWRSAARNNIITTMIVIMFMKV